jgi:glycosyltransferase involved in cell wall biosynthesis
MSELIRNGENGFLVDSLDEAVTAVGEAATLDRQAVRASVEERFAVERMVDDYLAVYRQVVALDRAGRADAGR